MLKAAFRCERAKKISDVQQCQERVVVVHLYIAPADFPKGGLSNSWRMGRMIYLYLNRICGSRGPLGGYFLEPAGMAGEGMKYNVPEWGCNCQKQYQYFMEIIKGGEEIGRVEFDEQETLMQPGGWLLIGRLPPDDPLPHLTMTHPSVSRQHAALQMKGNGQMYLYDLGSTHGSFLNKRKVRPKTFIPLRCGDLLRFGQSSRMYHLTSRSPSVLESIDLPISDLQAHVKATPEVFNGNYHELKAFMKKKEASQKATKKPARPGDSSEDEDEAQESSSAAFGSDEETSRVNDGNYFLGADGEDDP
jgi:pSer/pThr/pTyr-binding forkhead associated (FHA) protein